MTNEELQELISEAEQATYKYNAAETERLAHEVLKELDTSNILPEDKQIFRCNALRYLGIAASINHNYPSALEFLRQSLSIAEQLGDNRQIGVLYDSIGGVYYHKTDYPQALEYYYKALEITEKHGTKKFLGVVLADIGLLNLEMGEYERALHYNIRALAIEEELKNQRGITTCLGNIGNIYGNLGDYQKSLEYFQKGLAIAEQIGNHRSIIAKLTNIGSVYYNLKEYGVSNEYFHRALALSEEHSYIIGAGVSLGNLARTLADPKFEFYDLDKSLEYSLRSLTLFEEAASKQYIYLTHKNLADIYKQQEQWKMHSYHFARYHEIEKEVITEETKRMADKYAYELQITEQEKKIEIEQARNEEILRQKHILEEQAANIQLKNTELHEKNIELNLANRQLEEAGKFKMKILGIASHDLKNPITGINMTVEMLIKYASLQPDIVKKLNMIMSTSKRMLDIVVNLMDVAARELGEIKLSRTTFDVSSLIEEITNEYQPRASEKKQFLEFLSHGNCTITADELCLRQVFDNLISNAIKYTEHEKEIRVSVVATKENIKIAIADQGLGLSEEDKALMFKDFQKLSARPTGGEGSTGLGLSVVKNLVELHGGKVWAESEGKGMGSTFVVELPL